MRWYVPCSVNNISVDLHHYSMKKVVYVWIGGGGGGGGGVGQLSRQNNFS